MLTAARRLGFWTGPTARCSRCRSPTRRRVRTRSRCWTSSTTGWAPTTTTRLLAINLSSVIVATDADGDFIPLTGALTISVENDIPVQSWPSPVTQDGLRGPAATAGGNPDTPAKPEAFDGDRDAGRPGVFGADEPVTFTLSPTTSGLPQNLTSNGAPVVYNVTGNTADGVC